MTDELVSNLAHLYRRAGFGAQQADLERLRPGGYNAAVDALLDRTTPDQADAIARPQLISTLSSPGETQEQKKARRMERAQQQRELELWWLQRMHASTAPLREKLTLFWHGHFATSIEKVREPSFMLMQNETFRSLGAGSFEALAQAVAKDPAMLIWLDSNLNRKGSPNENFARELMELFTIGIGSYTDADVREAARAFTGWRVNRKNAMFNLQVSEHDAASKSVLGKTGPLSGEEVISLLANHPAAARFVTSKLWSRFAFPVLPTDPIVTDLAKGFTNGGEISAVMKSIFLHPEFLSKRAKQGLVKQPIEWLVGAMRALGFAQVSDVKPQRIISTLSDLNQVPFDPPSVGGWPQNSYWISTATTQARLGIAVAFVRAANLDWLTSAAPQQRFDVLAARLGVDGWASATRTALAKASDPKSQLTIALVSPEYVLN
jgi:uncharacterized protein (DUF1800 family)